VNQSGLCFTLAALREFFPLLFLCFLRLFAAIPNAKKKIAPAFSVGAIPV
jgi:hypothetical protein